MEQVVVPWVVHCLKDPLEPWHVPFGPCEEVRESGQIRKTHFAIFSKVMIERGEIGMAQRRGGRRGFGVREGKCEKESDEEKGDCDCGHEPSPFLVVRTVISLHSIWRVCCLKFWGKLRSFFFFCFEELRFSLVK